MRRCQGLPRASSELRTDAGSLCAWFPPREPEFPRFARRYPVLREKAAFFIRVSCLTLQYIVSSVRQLKMNNATASGEGCLCRKGWKAQASVMSVATSIRHYWQIQSEQRS